MTGNRLFKGSDIEYLFEPVASPKFRVLSMGNQVLQYLALRSNGFIHPLVYLTLSESC